MSFRIKGTSSTQDVVGTRSGLHGQNLISGGIGGLDDLLGGGISLGTLVFLVGENASLQSVGLLKHFAAEGVACGQRISWVSCQRARNSVVELIPGQSKQPSSGRGGVDESDTSELRIAWQYRRYIRSKVEAETEAEKKQSSGHIRAATGRSRPRERDWCHRFDMGTSVGEEGLKQTGACLHVAECRGAEALREAEAHVCKNVEETMRALQPGAGRAGESPTVARVVVEDLGSPGWELGPGAAEGSLALLYRLRGLLRGTRCAAVVTVNPAHFPAGWCRRACHLADTVLSVEALHDDSVLVGLSPDPGTAVGRVSLLKSSPVGALGSAPAGAGGQQRLLRHRRRRLALEEISIDPDAEQALSEQPAGAASLGDGKQLDF